MNIKEELLENGLRRLKIYEQVIRDIQSGRSETEACLINGVAVGKFRYWVRGDYVRKNKSDKDYSDNYVFFSWKDELMFNITGNKNVYIYDDFEESWEYIKTTLTSREVQIIELIYKEGLTFEEIGKIFSVLGERVRQIEAKTLRKLRHPDRLNCLMYGKDYIDKLEAIKQEEKENYIKRLNNKLNDFRANLVKDYDAAYEVNIHINAKIEDLELSVRTYNCLRRARLNTVADILNYNKVKCMYNIRNFGIKSFYELKDKLNEFLGYDSGIKYKE